MQQGSQHQRPIISVGAMVKTLHKTEVAKRMRAATRSMPFKEETRRLRVVTMRDKQRAWMLHGLRHLEAPVEPRSNDVSCKLF